MHHYAISVLWQVLIRSGTLSLWQLNRIRKRTEADVVSWQPAEQGADPAEVDEAEVVQVKMLVVDHNAAEVPQLGVDLFDLPPALVAAQRSAILNLSGDTLRVMRE